MRAQVGGLQTLYERTGLSSQDQGLVPTLRSIWGVNQQVEALSIHFSNTYTKSKTVSIAS